MSDSKRILKIKNKRFYFTENDFINIENTNIPSGSMYFKYKFDIYWEVELSDYDQESKSIRVKVIDYNPIEISNFVNQKQKRALRKIHFEKFDWLKIEPQLFSYTECQLIDIIFNHPIYGNQNEINPLPDNINNDGIVANSLIKKRIEEDLIDERKKSIIQINEIFSYSYKNAEFKNGFVRVKYKHTLISKKIEIDITNNFIRSEFNNIKNYFPKHFNNGKKIIVQIKGEICFGQLIGYSATSEEIQSINEDVISKIKDLVTIDLFEHIPEEITDKSIHSVEGIFEKSKLEKPVKDFIKKDPTELLGTYLKIKKVKNKKQLEYLSGYKQKGNYQIKFTIKPFFGFLFYIESSKNNNFCWELLNSHATYVWSFNNQLDSNDKLNQIDNIINYIIKNGREKYKKLLKTNPHPDITFNLVSHKNKKNQNGDNFVEWKNKIEKILNKII